MHLKYLVLVLALGSSLSAGCATPPSLVSVESYSTRQFRVRLSAPERGDTLIFKRAAGVEFWAVRRGVRADGSYGFIVIWNDQPGISDNPARAVTSLERLAEEGDGVLLFEYDAEGKLLHVSLDDDSRRPVRSTVIELRPDGSHDDPRSSS